MAKQINVKKGSKKYRAKALSRLRKILTRRLQRLGHSKVRLQRIGLLRVRLWRPRPQRLRIERARLQRALSKPSP